MATGLLVVVVVSKFEREKREIVVYCACMFGSVRYIMCIRSNSKPNTDEPKKILLFSDEDTTAKPEISDVALFFSVTNTHTHTLFLSLVLFIA